MSDRMTLEEYHEMNRTGKLPKRLRQKTRMEVIADVAAQDPALAEQAAEVGKKRNKYGAIKVEDDGIKFDSKKEHRRYLELKAFEAAKAISDLEVHPSYPLEVNGVRISVYTPDFRYRDIDTGNLVIEDVKGGNSTKTRAYVMRRKLMKAIYDIDVQEV